MQAGMDVDVMSAEAQQAASRPLTPAGSTTQTLVDLPMQPALTM